MISQKQSKAITALLSSRSIKEAAEVAQVGYRTLQRWLEDDKFKMALDLAESELISESIRALALEMGANIKLLKRVRDDETQLVSERRKAAVSLDMMLLRWRHHFTVEKRIVNLESYLNSGRHREQE